MFYNSIVFICMHNQSSLCIVHVFLSFVMRYLFASLLFLSTAVGNATCIHHDVSCCLQTICVIYTGVAEDDKCYIAL